MIALKERMANWRSGADARHRWLTAVFLVLLGYLLLTVLLGMYWSMAPARFDVEARAAQYAEEDGSRVATGSVTTAALIGVMETLLEKPGGYLHNDVFPPGLWLDNIPNWEYGVLIQSRDLARALREVLSRSQSQSTEDKDLSLAEPRFNFTADSWMGNPSIGTRSATRAVTCGGCRTTMPGMPSSTPAPTTCATGWRPWIPAWGACPSGSVPAWASAA